MAIKKNGRSASVPKPTKRKRPEAPAGPDKGVTIVGIAGSAGALGALQSFFDALPGQTGLAFVVITHLHPEHESHMAALLQSHTKMVVSQVNRKTAVKPDHVYVIPPRRNIQITDSHVDVAQFDEPRGQRTPIDFFFRSLASAHRDAIAIILSGGGTDGAVGVKAIKEEGGLLMVQDPQEAQYESMPSAAIATGLADTILPVSELASKLMQYVKHEPKLPQDADGLGEGDWDTISRILAQVQRHTGHDFSQYKRSTILRRIRRRMQIHSHVTLDAYLEYLRGSHEEDPAALLNDLLIGVTNFFRDPAAWDALARAVIPSIFKRKDPAEQVRVWSIGCATGEEAYSLAILLLEYAASRDERYEIQIFASDLDEVALTRAREGISPAAIEGDVSPERLERFFIRQDNHYQVRRDLRDMVLFTNHSILRDPPFSRQDLLCCRNLLIYMQHDIQQHVMDIFHYALNPVGYLFLGGSESTDGADGLFQPIDKTHRIYQSRPRKSERPHVPSLPLGIQPLEPSLKGGQPSSLAKRLPKDALLVEDQHQKSLEAYGPPSILLNGDYSILHISDSAGRYLLPPRGPITSDLLKLARPELQLELRTALFQAFDKGKAVVTPPVDVTLDGKPCRVTLSVRPRKPLTENGKARERQALVLFLEDEIDGLPHEAAPKADRDLARGRARISHLETEAERLREQLQITTEEYDSSNEEMKAANEELQSINEEYHLTTEELETSKEELEAVNEELQTVNNELKMKLDEVSRAQRDLESVLGSTEIATLYLDRSLRIQRYTPTLTQFFDILNSDIGRPIAHLNHKLGYSQLIGDAQGVMDSGDALDREVPGENGAWFLMRIRPYRTVGSKRIEGVVITFVDITAVRRAEAALEDLNETLEARVDERTRELEGLNRKLEHTGGMFSMLFHVNPIPTSLTRLEDGYFYDVNEAYLEYFGQTREAVIGHTASELNLPLPMPQRARLVSELRKAGIVRNVEFEVVHPSGGKRTVLASLQHFTVEDTEAMLSTFIDITHRVEAERQIRGLASNLTAAEQKERHRISQVLHDDLQQRLFAVKMQLSFLQDAYLKNDLETVRKDSANLESWLSEAIETTRRLSIDLSPIILQGENLADALSWLDAQVLERYGLDVALRVRGPVPRLDDDLRIMLFHTVRELLFNVVKHAETAHAIVTLEQINDRLRIIVSDHGKGFDGDGVMADAQAAHGLLDTRNRLNLLGCNMQVHSKPGDGTEILIDAPIQRGAT